MLYDFIIVGTGPSGSVLASNLGNAGFKIAMIDRATEVKKNDKNSFIYSPYINNSPFNYTPLFSNQLGGNSALWNNKCYLISKEEFNSENWGFDYKELKKNSELLSKKFKIDHNKVNKKIVKDKYTYSKSYRIKKLGNIFYYLKIKQQKNIKIFSHSSPIKLIFDNKKKIKSIIIKDILINKEMSLEVSRAVIFCAGGLGNPHILQNLLKDVNKKIGVYLSDHPHINLGNFNSKIAKKSSYFGKYFLNKNSDTENNLYLQKEKKFVGINLDLSGDGTKIIKKIYCKLNRLTPKVLLVLLIKYYNVFLKCINKVLSITNVKGKYSFEFFFSQEKNVKNSVKIIKNTKDNFGNYKSNINWFISKKDKKQYQRFINSIIGTKGSFNLTNKNYSFLSKNITTGLHPSCTTQISSNKLNGVVDKNLKMFGYKNIFICGSSVFRLNGFTNPTWTIMTLANRLSRHLNNLY